MKKAFLVLGGSIGVLGLAFLGFLLLIVVTIAVVIGFRELTQSDQPTREPIGGMSEVAMKNYWLEQAAVKEYELTIQDWGPRDTLGGKRYSVDYSLNVTLKDNYTYTDSEAFLKAVVDSLWYTNGRAPEGLVTIVVNTGGSAPVAWEPLINELLDRKSTATQNSGEPTSWFKISTNTSELEKTLGPWTGGPKPELESIFRPLSASNPSDKVELVPGLANGGMSIITTKHSSGEVWDVTCFRFNGTYGANEQLNSIYRMPVTMEVYLDGYLWKSETFERLETDEDFWEPSYRKEYCYKELWDLSRVTGKLTWPDATGYTGGSQEAKVGN